jgi:Tfp pilus assembly protein PilO
VNRRLLFGLIIAALVVVVALVWFFMLSPMRNDIASTKDAIQNEQVRLAAAQAKLAQAEVTRQEGRRNQARLLELAKLVPPSDEIPSLLLQIQALADQSGITFMAITPGDLIRSTDFQILPLQVEFKGTFFPLNDFLYRIERMAAGPGRLLATKQLNLQLGDLTPDGQQLSVMMTIYAFEMAGSTRVGAASTGGASAGSATPATSEPAGTVTTIAPSGK